jgi:flavodoxin
MQKRKNILILTFVLLLSFVMTGCGGRENTSGTSQATGGNKNDAELSQEQEPSSSESMESSDEAETAEMGTAERQTEKMETGDMSEENGRILIAYFSHTGNTAEAAQAIAEYTGGDLAEIKREEEYGDLQEEAEVEIKDGIHPEITVSVSNVEDYDTVFVGYPIWFDEAPAMIATFLAENDFIGKTIVPFCTSAGDSIENSLHIFEELSTDAEILEGLTVEDETDIEPWLENLGLLS